MIARLKLASHSVFILQYGTSVALILEEVVVVVALVSHLLIERYVKTYDLLSALSLLSAQMDVEFVLNHLELPQPFTSLFDFLLPLLSQLVLDLFLYLALPLNDMR